MSTYFYNVIDGQYSKIKKESNILKTK